MTERRPLTEEEKEIYKKVLIRNQEEKEELEHEVLLQKMFLEKGAAIAIRRAIRKAEKELSLSIQQLKELEAMIATHKEHLAKGVFKKEENNEEE